MSTTCPSVICTPPEDLRFYGTQGFAPQPLPPTPPPGCNFRNDEAWFNDVCQEGSASFSGALPEWVNVDSGNNRIGARAGFFCGATIIAANESAESALNQFVIINLQNGNISCGSNCSGTDTHIYAIAGYTDGLIPNPDGGDGIYPTWNGTFPLKDSGDGCKWGGWTEGQAIELIDGKKANCARIVFNSGVWTLSITNGNAALLWSGTKMGSTPAGTYTNDNTGLDNSPVTLTVEQIAGTATPTTLSVCAPD